MVPQGARQPGPEPHLAVHPADSEAAADASGADVRAILANSFQRRAFLVPFGAQPATFCRALLIRQKMH